MGVNVGEHVLDPFFIFSFRSARSIFIISILLISIVIIIMPPADGALLAVGALLLVGALLVDDGEHIIIIIIPMPSPLSLRCCRWLSAELASSRRLLLLPPRATNPAEVMPIFALTRPGRFESSRRFGGAYGSVRNEAPHVVACRSSSRSDDDVRRSKAVAKDKDEDDFMVGQYRGEAGRAGDGNGARLWPTNRAVMNHRLGLSFVVTL